ncbi:MAG: gamma-glutamyltransferase [Roseomonas sp.]|nr:gamma-glutamyltransferase [Roseomonas sp.]MCA3299537.1 gamma-glutamyltransferase [Roseomonas sp.]
MMQHGGRFSWGRGLLGLGLGVLLVGCQAVESTVDRTVDAVTGRSNIPFGTPGHVSGFLGGVAADEPRAAIVARDILSGGGSAVDAAVAGAFTMAVTLPSRAGLGGGGACVALDAQRGTARAIIFPAGARTEIPQGTDRPAALPAMARGLFALHLNAGRFRIEDLIRPAEDLARLGTEISRTLADDLAVVAGPLLADPSARQVFARPGGGVLRLDDRITQPDLSATLAQLRAAPLGIGDLYQGSLAERLVEGSIMSGGGLTEVELRTTRVRVGGPSRSALGSDLVLLSTEASSGMAGALQAAMAGQIPGVDGAAGAGAGASLITLDREGNAVSCAFSMNNLFGTGRIVPGTGILLAAAPGIGQVQAAPLPVAILARPDLRRFRAAASGSGGQAALAATAMPLAAVQRRGGPADPFAAVPAPGRGVTISCAGLVPTNGPACIGAADPRGGGVALGSFGR